MYTNYSIIIKKQWILFWLSANIEKTIRTAFSIMLLIVPNEYYIKFSHINSLFALIRCKLLHWRTCRNTNSLKLLQPKSLSGFWYTIIVWHNLNNFFQPMLLPSNLSFMFFVGFSYFGTANISSLQYYFINFLVSESVWFLKYNSNLCLSLSLFF